MLGDDQMRAICQICHKDYFDWTIKEINFTIGYLKYYKIQACEKCTEALENSIKDMLVKLGGG